VDAVPAIGGTECPGPSARRPASLALTFANGPQGRVFLERQYAAYPFHVCKVLYEDPELPGMGTLYMQSSAGGIYEHDRHAIDIVTRPGAMAHVTSQASTIVHSMRDAEARLDLTVQAGPGSLLEVLPDPQILFPGSAFAGRTEVSVANDAVVILAESFLTHDPAGEGGTPLRYRSEIVVKDEAGRILAIDRMALSQQTFAAPAPGVMGAFMAYGTLLVLAPGRADKLIPDAASVASFDIGSALIGTSALPQGAGQLFRILAVDGAGLKRASHKCWALARLAVTGHAPRSRRK
jgi:urease accessory protein